MVVAQLLLLSFDPHPYPAARSVRMYVEVARGQFSEPVGPLPVRWFGSGWLATRMMMSQALAAEMSVLHDVEFTSGVNLC